MFFPYIIKTGNQLPRSFLDLIMYDSHNKPASSLDDLTKPYVQELRTRNSTLQVQLFEQNTFKEPTKGRNEHLCLAQKSEPFKGADAIDGDSSFRAPIMKPAMTKKTKKFS